MVLPGVPDHVFTRLGLDRPALLPMRRITAAQTTILPDGSIVRLGDQLDLSLERSTPPDKTLIQKELQRAVDKWEPLLRLFDNEILLRPFSFGRMLRKGWRHLPKP